MAQEVMIAGALFSNVPSIKVPDSNNVFHSFVDPSDTTATASDVAQGKYFYAADGTRTLGTKTDQGVSVVETLDSHGGTIVEITGATVKPIQMGVLRPDAELVNRWTMDQYAVADLNLTIPAYSTANATIRAGQNLETYVGDPLNYRYFLTARTLTIPVYNIATLAKGREEYAIEYGFYEWLYNPTGQMSTLDGSKEYGVYSQVIGGGYGRELYWSSATGVGIYTSDAYCARQGLTAPQIASNKNLTIKSPNISIRGHATYLAQTFFEAIEDIRCQYVIELWRAPLTGVDGWVLGTQMDSIFDNIKNNSGKLV